MIRELDRCNKEIDHIMNIWLESTIQAHPFINEGYWRRNYNVVKMEYLPQSETFVYTENGEVFGFISIVNREFIGALFVKTKKQGEGIGAQLIEYIKWKYEKLSLAVYVENKDAVSFYQKMGFGIVTEQLNEDSQMPEYIMSTSITDRK